MQKAEMPMGQEAITPFDLGRMFLGEQPPLFYLEIVVRTIIIYVYGLVLLRWLGGRTIGQLSTVEFLLVIALGSAVGDPMFYPDVPLLHGMAVMTVVVLANKVLDMLIGRFKTAEHLLDGIPVSLVENGVVSKECRDGDALGANELFQQLRQREITQLGQVHRAFSEPDGIVTVFKADAARPGLPIMPPWEILKPEQIKAGTMLRAHRVLSCMKCGTTPDAFEAGSTVPPCPTCRNESWTPAALVEG